MYVYMYSSRSYLFGTRHNATFANGPATDIDDMNNTTTTGIRETRIEDTIEYTNYMISGPKK